jgi:hypothetical protein
VPLQIANVPITTFEHSALTIASDAATERAHTSQLPASSDDPSRGSSGFNGPPYRAGSTGWFERKRSAGSYAAFTARMR